MSKLLSGPTRAMLADLRQDQRWQELLQHLEQLKRSPARWRPSASQGKEPPSELEWAYTSGYFDAWSAIMVSLTGDESYGK